MTEATTTIQQPVSEAPPAAPAESAMAARNFAVDLVKLYQPAIVVGVFSAILLAGDFPSALCGHAFRVACAHRPAGDAHRA